MLAMGLAVAAALVAAGPRSWELRALRILGTAGLASLAAGLWLLLGGPIGAIVVPLGTLPWHLVLDPLSAIFLLPLGVVVMVIALYAKPYLHHMESGTRRLGVATGFFVASMILVLLANHAFTFMLGWEGMALASYLLVIQHHEQSANRQAGFLYLLLAHMGALTLLLSFGLLAHGAGGLGFAQWRTAPASASAMVALVLAFVAFAAKAGLVPLHVWLPQAHPAAPSHISALMSAVMLKMAIYGMVRLCFDLVPVHAALGLAIVMIAAGALSMVLGVVLALVQQDLKRALACSSIENMGLITMALGLALLYRTTGHATLAALALGAALLHVLNHALLKALLFLGAGALQQTCATRDLGCMGGLLRRMPASGSLFLLGCLGLAAIPPLNGFASEWLLFQAALQSWQVEQGILRSLIPLAAACLALATALATACLLRLFASAFLGQARSREARRATEAPRGMLLAQGGLAALCVFAGLFPGLLLRLVNQVTMDLLHHPAVHIATALVVTPVSAVQASYAPLVVLAVIGIVALLTAILLHTRKRPAPRRVPPWACGLGPPTARMQITPAALGMPLRQVFGGLLVIHERLGGPQGRRYHLEIADRTWGLFYEPVAAFVMQLSRHVARLQSGRVRLYLGFSLGTLLILLWVMSW